MLRPRLGAQLTLGTTLLFVAACGTEDSSSTERGRQAIVRTAKSDSLASCAGICGANAPSGCYCDEACAAYGDCCADKADACDHRPGSCRAFCGGKSSDGCYCDAACASYGDCCQDKAVECDKPVCKGPNPAGCSGTNPCPKGEVCTGSGHSSGCTCMNSSTGPSWVCTPDMSAGKCVKPSEPTCKGLNPAGCHSNSQCAKGEVCKVDSSKCISSGCTCMDSATGPSWVCTPDCSGGACVKQEAPTCKGPNPAGCTANSQCAKDEVCKVDSSKCVSSGCTCMNSASGPSWVCTPDCSGGACVKK